MSAEPTLPFDPDTEPLDVGRIVEAVREWTRTRRAAGVLTVEDVEDRTNARLRAFAEKAYVDPRLLDRFLRPGHDYNIAADYVVRSHRPGLAARLSVLVKRAVRPLVRLYTDEPLNRQAQVNQYLREVLHHAVREIVKLEARVAALEELRAAGSERRGTDKRSE